MAEFPLFPVYPQRWIADLGHLDIEIQGALFVLILHAWLQPDNGLPDDDRDIARRLGIHLTRWRRIGPEVRQHFESIKGRIYNKGASKERQYLADKSEKGRTLVEKRWQKFRANLLKENETADTGRIYNPTLPTPSKEEDDATASSGTTNGAADERGHHGYQSNGLERPAEPVRKAARKASSHGTRLDPNFRPSAASLAVAAELGLDAEAELPEFFGYWCALPGSKALKLDWDLTFQNRLRDVAGRRPAGTGHSLAAGRFGPTRKAPVSITQAVFEVIEADRKRQF